MLVFLLILTIFTYSNSVSIIDEPEPPEYSIYRAFITLLPPIFLKNISDIKSFVRSNEFADIRKQKGDIAAVDEIYNYSAKLTHGNTGIALLICTIATIDHYTLGLRIPIFNLYLPLTNETTALFNERIKNLPTKIYPEHFKLGGNGRDKLQHFFGSAFITYISESQRVAENFSEFVENIEARYIKNGLYDNSDIEANKLGQLYGLILMQNQKAKPSDVLNKKK